MQLLIPLDGHLGSLLNPLVAGELFVRPTCLTLDSQLLFDERRGANTCRSQVRDGPLRHILFLLCARLLKVVLLAAAAVALRRQFL